MADAADRKVYDVIDNSNTPYGKSELSQHYHPGSFDDPSDRAAKDIIGQLKTATTPKIVQHKNMNYFREDDSK